MRNITSNERFILEQLINRSGMVFKNWRHNIKAIDMKDGDMGSIILIPDSETNLNKRKFGKRVSELMYDDTDGVRVIFSLNLDSEGMLYELDIWKTDYKPVLKYPSSTSDFVI